MTPTLLRKSFQRHILFVLVIILSFSKLLAQTCTPASLPYTQGFSSTTIPTCWSTAIVQNQTSSKISFINTYVYYNPVGGFYTSTYTTDGTQMVQYDVKSTNGEERLISAPLNTTGLSKIDLEFNWWMEGFSTGTNPNEGVQVQYSTDGGTTWNDAAAFIPRNDLAVGPNGQFVFKRLTLPTAVANRTSILIGFKFHGESSSYNLLLDDVAIKAAACNAGPASLPFTQGFNSVAIPSCWSTAIVQNQTSSKISFISSYTYYNPVGLYYTTASSQEGTQMVRYDVKSTNGEERLISTPLNTTGVSKIDLEFYWWMEGFSTGTNSSEGVQVQYSTDGGASWNDAGPFMPRNDPAVGPNGLWFFKRLPLPAAICNQPSVLVGFKFHGSGSNYSLLLDNVVIKAAACAAGSLSLPYSQGFNSTVLPSCWSTAIVQNQASSQISFVSSVQRSGNFYTPQEGSQLVQYSKGSNTSERLISTPLNTAGLGNVEVDFYWFAENSGSSNSSEGVQLEYSTDGGIMWSNAGPFIPVYDATLTAGTQAWVLKKVTLPNAANSSSMLISFKFQSQNLYTLAIDNLIIKQSSCQSPTSVNTSSVTSNSASISFTGTGNNFIVEYGPTGFTPGTGAAAGSGGTIVTTTSSPVSLTGLNANTSYQVYIRQNCSSSSNGYSINTGPASFTTPCVTNVAPGVSIASNQPSPVCSNIPVTFTATPTNGGSAPTYQWKLNGSVVGGNSAVYTAPANTLTNGDVVSVQMTSNASCLTTNTANASVTMNVTTAVTPSVSLTASTTNPCQGSPVTFTATPNNGGSSPTYQWFVNNISQGTTTTNTFTTTTLNTNDQVYVKMTTSLTCVTASTANSGAISVVVNSLIAPSVVASVSPGTTICQGTNAIFTATPTGGAGSSPTYQWFLNNVSQGTSSTVNTFSSNTLNNNDQVKVVMTSSATCPSSPTVPSNVVAMQVNAPVTPSVVITANIGWTICSNSAVTFTATPSYGGTSPAYQWRLNGVIVGTNSSQYFAPANSLKNGDVISVQMTSSASCVTTTIANASGTMNVADPVTPSVTMSSSASGAVCQGTPITFTATPTNGGTNPTYQWFVNGVSQGITSANSITLTTLNNSDQVYVKLTSDLTCVTVQTAISTPVNVTITTKATPSVTINATPAGAICQGTNVTFNATPNNGGSTPGYQWYVGSTPVGSNTASYSSSGLVNGDVVKVVMTTAMTCVTTPTATSNNITMQVNTKVTPIVTVAAPSTVCAGSNVTFTASTTNTGGGTISYQFKDNGTPLGTASTSNSYTGALTAGAHNITCDITITGGSCITTSTASSAAVVVTASGSITPSITITASPNGPVCQGTNVTFTTSQSGGGTTPSYQWFVGAAQVGAGASYSSATLNNGDVVKVVMTSNASCAVPASASAQVTMSVNPSTTPSVTITPNPAGAVCQGTTVTFTANPTGGGTTPTYQWSVGSTTQSGVTGNTFNTNALNNGDVVKVVMTSNASCVTSTATAQVTAQVTTKVIPTVNISSSPMPVCPGDFITVTANATNAGSNPTYDWILNGAVLGSNSSFNYYTYNGFNNGDKVSVVVHSTQACVTSSTASSGQITIAVNTPVTPSVTISASPNTTNICAGSFITFTAAPVNGGTAPSYQWKINGSPVGANSNTYTTNTLANGDVVTVVMTTNAACATATTATSNAITMTVNPVAAPTINISASANNVCQGTNITFNTATTGGGASPTYQWYIGTVAQVGATGTSFSSATLNNGDVVKVVVTTSNSCATATTASAQVTMQINSKATPTVSVNPSGNSVCEGTSITLTATAANTGGGTIMYQFQDNGVNLGAASTSNTYSGMLPAGSHAITCSITITGGNCIATTSATSSPVTVNVNSTVTPSVSFSANTNGTICQGTSVTFTANPIGGGSAPTYQWFVGSTQVSNSVSYTSSTLNNGDVVKVVMTSNAACASPASVFAQLTMTVKPIITPSVTITPNPAGSVCEGTNVTFTANPTGGGTSPAYQWFVNNTSQGAASAANTFNSNALSNNDQVKVVMTTSASCPATPTATSTPVTMSVTPKATPTVSVAAQNATVCTGTNVQLTATAANTGGGTITYQFKDNGAPLGAASTANTYNGPLTVGTHSITCDISITGGYCINSTAASSMPITVTINSSITPSVLVSTNTGNTICQGTTVNFIATQTGGGATPSYQWYVNNTQVGTNAATYSSNSLSNNDIVKVVMTSSASCATTPTVNGQVAMTVNPSVTPSVSITSDANGAVCEGTTITFTAAPSGGGNNPTYQWFVNNVDKGVTGNTFTTNALVNNDQVKVVMTSNAACYTAASAASSPLTMFINAKATPTISVSAQNATVCAGSNVLITAAAANTGGGTVAYQFKDNGANMGTASASNTYNGTLSVGTHNISCDISIAGGCVTANAVSSTPITVTVNSSVTPTVSIATPSATVCDGANVTFTSTATNTGTTPVYQWKINGVNVGTNSISFTTDILRDGDIVTLQMTSNAVCPSPATVTATPITMKVNQNLNASVTISASPSGPICEGTPVTFTAAPQNGGTAPTYRWKINGINAATGNTFTTPNLSNNDQVTVTMTPVGVCTVMSPVSSTPVTMTVNTKATPAVIINASQTTVCPGSSVSFVAQPAAGGTAPKYEWFINGGSQGTAAAANTFSTNNINDGDQVTVQMTSNDGCVTTNTVLSDPTTLHVSNTVVPSVTITSSASGSVCAGTSITVVATPVNAGTTPTYQWKVNGANVGTNNSSFTTTTLSDNDIITVDMTSSASCASPLKVTSNSITAHIIPTVTPSVTIAPSATSICEGSAVSFVATPSGGGTVPGYQWKVNGNNVGANSDTYNSTSLVNNDVVSVEMISSAACPAIPKASASVTMTVNQKANPAVTIATPLVAVCPASPVTFTATPVSGGNAPVYQWKLNGNDVGTNSATYTAQTVNNNDQVSLVMTSNAGCVTTNTANSNVLTMTVNSSVIPSVSISTAATAPICQGNQVSFTATPVNGGLAPVYQWKVNGVKILGATASTYTTNTLVNGDEVSVEMTSNAVCPSPAKVTSNSITMAITVCNGTPSEDPDIITTGLLPNVVESNTTLRVNARNTTKIQWRMIDSKGRTIMVFAQDVHPGANDLKLYVGNLAGGIYQLTGATTKGKVNTLRFLRP